MSSSLQATGGRPSVADWGGGISVCCTAGPIVRLHGQWGHIMHHGIISSFQSASTSEIVKRFWSRV